MNVIHLRRFATVRWLALWVLALAGCGDRDPGAGIAEATGQKQPVATSATPAPAPGVLGSTIEGVVSFRGQVPSMAVMDMSVDPVCAEKNESAQRRFEDLVVANAGGVANAIVTITEGLPLIAHPTPTDPVVLDQDGCRYGPHVLVLRVGQQVRILNPDATLHNVHVYSSKNPQFNEAMPNFRPEIIKVIHSVEPDPFAIRCDLHPWMLAYAVVLDHPYHAVSDLSGAFRIDKLPAGTFTIQVWHERLGTRTQSVTVAENSTQQISFTMEAP